MLDSKYARHGEIKENAEHLEGHGDLWVGFAGQAGNSLKLCVVCSARCLLDGTVNVPTSDSTSAMTVLSVAFVVCTEIQIEISSNEFMLASILVAVSTTSVAAASHGATAAAIRGWERREQGRHRVFDPSSTRVWRHQSEI